MWHWEWVWAPSHPLGGLLSMTEENKVADVEKPEPWWVGR